MAFEGEMKLFEALPSAALLVGSDGHVQSANRLAGELFGKTTDALRGRIVGELLADPHEPRGAWFERLTSDGGRRELDGERAGTGPIKIEITAARHDAEDGSVRFLLLARDNTQTKEREAQLMAADRLASVSTLAATVAHEINTPLATILTNLELAEHEVSALLPAQQTELLRAELGDARQAAERVRLIVKDVKIFARHDEGRDRSVDVRAVLESSLRLLWNEVRHRARVIMNLDEVPHVVGDKGRLGQVFLDLIINAMHAIPIGAAGENQLTVRAFRSTGSDVERVVVEIEDSGVGMTEDLQRSLFTPFFTTRPAGEGAGLGLHTARRILTGLGGHITVRSTPGRGSTFSVALPIARVMERADVQVAPKKPRRGRVLVVDDDAMFATAMRRVLERDSEVLISLDGTEALQLLQSGSRFDVVLCDLMMPQMSGMELYDHILRMDALQAERVVFLTGGAFTATGRAFLARTPNLRLEKPVETEELRRIVRERVAAIES